MRKFFPYFLAVCLLHIAYGASSYAVTTNLYLFGGGKKPASALQDFLIASSQGSNQVLFIAWATAYPNDSCDAFKKDSSRFSHIQIECLSREDTLRNLKFAEKIIRESSGIFFSGGDQSKIMSLLDALPDLSKALKERFFSGVPVGGTSAGTAIQSDWMILRELIPGSSEPDAVELRQGLGLMRRGFVLDQHFLKRSRDQRLMAAMKKSGSLYGLGVDEDAAVKIIDSRYLEVFHGVSRLYEMHPQGFIYRDFTPASPLFDLESVP